MFPGPFTTFCFLQHLQQSDAGLVALVFYFHVLVFCGLGDTL